MRDKKKPEPTAALLSPKQAATLLGISLSGVLHAIQRGRLDVVRFGEIALIPRSAIDRYIQTKSKGGRPHKQEKNK